VWEETDEFREALASGRRDRIRDEMGDVLFAVVNVARLLDMDAEEVLRRANGRFVDRFRYIERWADERDVRLEDMTLGEMDAVWNEAKKAGL
jgi:uncharacterized protein YabN with tetrapyrrole methylase and pyrophosphatase domain